MLLNYAMSNPRIHKPARRLIIVFLFIAVALSLGCQPKQSVIVDNEHALDNPLKGVLPEYESRYENHVNDTFLYPDQTYYSYSWRDEEGPCLSPFSLDTLISMLVEDGIVLSEIWYKRGSSMCYPPGANLGMAIVVEPSIVVRLDSEDDRMEEHCFRRVEVPGFPGMGSCPYKVQHLIFRERCID